MRGKEQTDWLQLGIDRITPAYAGKSGDSPSILEVM